MRNTNICYLDKLAEKYAKSVPGKELVHYYEAAFPVYKVILDITMQKEKPIGIIKEFCLKYVEAGAKTVDNLVNFLGLSKSVINSNIVQLYQADLIKIDFNNKDILSLTEKGRIALKEAKLIVPDDISYMFIIDALTGEYQRNESVDTLEFVKRIQRHIIPKYSDRPKIEELDISSIARIISLQQKETESKQLQGILLNINEIEKIKIEYRNMYILVFADNNGEIDIQVYDRQQRVEEYESILLRMIGEKYNILPLEVKNENLDQKDVLEALGNIVGEDRLKEALETDCIIKDTEKTIKEMEYSIHVAQEEYRETNDPSKTQLILQQKEEIEILKRELLNKPRMISTYEHRPLMFRALEEVKKQLVIVSPWIKKDAADYEFRQALERVLKRNIQVIICYGITKDEKDRSMQYALNLLKKLQQQSELGKNLKLVELGNTHEKVLICDTDFMISTSFNWLSFRGDPNRGFRRETGIYVEDKDCINKMINDLADQIRQETNEVKVMFSEMRD